MPFPSPGDLPDPGLLYCRQVLYKLNHCWLHPSRFKGAHTLWPSSQLPYPQSSPGGTSWIAVPANCDSGPASVSLFRLSGPCLSRGLDTLSSVPRWLTAGTPLVQLRTTGLCPSAFQHRWIQREWGPTLESLSVQEPFCLVSGQMPTTYTVAVLGVSN